MRPVILVSTVLAAAMATHGTARAQVTAPPVASARDAGVQAGALALTVGEAIERGLEASHRLAELRARADAAGAAVDLRDAADRPLVGLRADYVRTNHIDEFGILLPTGERRIIFPDLPNNYRARLDLQWPIYSGGRVDALERAAEAERQAAGQDVEAARADLRLEITRAYWALLTAQEAAGVLEAALERMDAQLRDVRVRFDTGFIPPNEVSAVEAERSRQELLFIEARNNREIAAASLRRLLDLPPETALRLESPLVAADAVLAPVDDLVARSLAQRAERRSLEQRIEAARLQGRAAAAGLRPTVSLAGGVDYARPNPRFLPRTDEWQTSWDAAVLVNWSLWDGGRTRAEEAQAVANLQALEARLRELDSTLRLEVRQRVLDLESARASVRAAVDGVRSASEARRVIVDRFEAGVATSTDVLDAQVALLQAELDRTRALANTRLAEARLERTVGQ